MTSRDIVAIADAVRVPLRDELLREVEDRIERFRRAVYVRDEWCCGEMVKFAIKTWGASKPRPESGEHFGSVTYQLRHHTVNYCPFCGVSFLAPRAASIVSTVKGTA